MGTLQRCGVMSGVGGFRSMCGVISIATGKERDSIDEWCSKDSWGAKRQRQDKEKGLPGMGEEIHYRQAFESAYYR